MNHDLKQGLQPKDIQSTEDLVIQQRIAAFRSSLALGIIASAIFAFGIYDFIPVISWLQVGTLIMFLVVSLSAFACAWMNRSKYVIRSIYLMLIAFWVCSYAVVSMTSGLGLVLAVGIFAMTIGITVQALPAGSINRLILTGTFVAVSIYLLDLLLPNRRNPASVEFRAALLLIVVPAFILFLVFLVQRYSRFPLLTKIVIPFVMISLASIGTLSAYNDAVNRRSLTDAANQILRAAAIQTSAEVDNFLISIANPLRTEATLPAFVNYISLPETERIGSPEEIEALSLLQYLQNRENILSYSIISRQGTVLLSTLASTPDQLAKLSIFQDIERAQPGALAVALLTEEVYISPVIYDLETNEPGIYFVMSIVSNTDTPSGYLVSHYSIRLLQTEIFVPLINLAGEGSFGVLISEDNVRLAGGKDSGLLDTLIVPPAEANVELLQKQSRLPQKPSEELVSDNPDFYSGLKKIVGTTTTSMFTTSEAGSEGLYNAVAVPLQQRPWKVVFMQPQEILLEPVNAQLRTTSLFVVLITSIAILASTLIAQTIAKPVGLLTDMASYIIQGNLNSRIPVTSQDEIGSLSRVFNGMTDQLQQTLTGLEQRVEERTRDLAEATDQAQNRSRQLEIIAEISRVIATERDPDQLLRLVVQMISEQMGFYHVGVFLLDAQKEFAVLRAANSIGGQHMLERGHRLRVGQQGIIGYVTSTGEPRVALDVGADAVFFNNPDLPETRSEMGLPLRSGDQIIGALDVQSTKSGAFTDEDVNLLSTLADQVSIAIENARLFSETDQALTELQSVQRQYLREQWDKTIENRRQVGFTYERGRVSPIVPESEEVMVLPSSHQRAGHLSIPITLRGELIGAIDLTDLDKNRVWSEDELRLAHSVAEQIGLALENARLIEESQRRAERESLVSQISTRLRASNDPQEILHTAVAELRHALRARTAHIVLPVEGIVTTLETTTSQVQQTTGDGQKKDDGKHHGKSGESPETDDKASSTDDHGTHEEK